MKNNDILLQYRSLQKPRPLWHETALYGGYEYIEITEGVWLPRIHEYVLQYAISGDNPALRKEAIKEIQSGEHLFKPSYLQQSDHTKLSILINKQAEVCIDKYSYTFEQFAQRFSFTKFYTTSSYTAPNFIQISEEEFCKRISTTLTLVNESSYSIKPKIRNWANVISYNSSFFDDSLAGDNILEGGDFIGTT